MNNTIQLIGLYTLVRKETVRIFRIWQQTLLPSVITTTLYFLIFGQFIGDRIGSFDNYSYIEFIVPGLIMMSIITTSYTNVASSFFGSKFQRNIEELLVSPLKPHFLILGYLSGGIIRGLIVGILVTIISILFSPIPFHNPLIIILCACFTSLLFSLAGFINGIYAKKFDDISIIPTFLLTPLIYLGGVFYSVKILPPVWQKISLLNPILYLVNIFRYGCLGISDINITNALIIMGLFIIFLWTITYTLVKKGTGFQN
jgi:ABC-2 type transport system permease protein